MTNFAIIICHKCGGPIPQFAEESVWGVKGLNYKADYLEAIVDCARATMIEQQANDSSKKYRNLSDTAKGAATELQKKKRRRRGTRRTNESKT